MTNIELVTKFSLDQGKFYLENAGEFYPYGSILRNDFKLVPVSVDMEVDYPDSSEIVRILETNILERIQTKDILAGAIGTDVNILLKNKSIEKIALEVRVISIDNDFYNFYLPYTIKAGELSYQEVIKEEGTLILA